MTEFDWKLFIGTRYTNVQAILDGGDNEEGLKGKNLYRWLTPMWRIALYQWNLRDCGENVLNAREIKMWLEKSKLIEIKSKYSIYYSGNESLSRPVNENAENINDVDENGQTALFRAVGSGNWKYTAISFSEFGTNMQFLMYKWTNWNKAIPRF